MHDGVLILITKTRSTRSHNFDFALSAFFCAAFCGLGYVSKQRDSQPSSIVHALNISWHHNNHNYYYFFLYRRCHSFVC